MKFTDKIIAILRGDKEIKGIPKTLLPDVDPCCHRLPYRKGDSPHINALMLKVAHLQTLIFMEVDNLSTSPIEDLQNQPIQVQNRINLNVTEVFCDSNKRLCLLEQLIVELVREAIPSESERFDVFYRLDSELHLVHKAGMIQ